MKVLRLTGIMLVVALMLTLVFPVFAAEKEYTGELTTKSIILSDMSDGSTLFEKDADTPMPGASTANIRGLLHYKRLHKGCGEIL